METSFLFMIRITNQYLWNFVFAVFFIGLVTMAAIILETEARLSYAELTLIDIVLMSLATYRLIRLVINDVGTKFFREQFWDTKESRGKIILVKPSGGPRRAIADVLSCCWCFGIWAAAMIIFFYLLTPYAQLPILILAIAGVGTWFQQLAALTGWKAEQTKNEVAD